ncbi:transporter, putative [Plasmodium malariae]|uniref:Transporter, putative n=1 Tax=Plasmodium malariae TaxID=5858 RepID=A0A1D3TC81_PLAMA|nr:transporter, putative [Plasmodium malariae]SCP02490.1 transporter, putative [Plasmodium malariae]
MNIQSASTDEESHSCYIKLKDETYKAFTKVNVLLFCYCCFIICTWYINMVCLYPLKLDDYYFILHFLLQGIGSVLIGLLSDLYGRKRCLNISFAILFVIFILNFVTVKPSLFLFYHNSKSLNSILQRGYYNDQIKYNDKTFLNNYLGDHNFIMNNGVQLGISSKYMKRAKEGGTNERNACRVISSKRNEQNERSKLDKQNELDEKYSSSKHSNTNNSRNEESDKSHISKDNKTEIVYPVKVTNRRSFNSAVNIKTSESNKLKKYHLSVGSNRSLIDNLNAQSSIHKGVLVDSIRSKGHHIVASSAKTKRNTSYSKKGSSNYLSFIHNNPSYYNVFYNSSNTNKSLSEDIYSNHKIHDSKDFMKDDNKHDDILNTTNDQYEEEKKRKNNVIFRNIYNKLVRHITNHLNENFKNKLFNKKYYQRLIGTCIRNNLNNNFSNNYDSLFDINQYMHIMKKKNNFYKNMNKKNVNTLNSSLANTINNNFCNNIEKVCTRKMISIYHEREKMNRESQAVVYFDYSPRMEDNLPQYNIPFEILNDDKDTYEDSSSQFWKTIYCFLTCAGGFFTKGVSNILCIIITENIKTSYKSKAVCLIFIIEKCLFILTRLLFLLNHLCNFYLLYKVNVLFCALLTLMMILILNMFFDGFNMSMLRQQKDNLEKLYSKYYSTHGGAYNGVYGSKYNSAYYSASASNSCSANERMECKKNLINRERTSTEKKMAQMGIIDVMDGMNRIGKEQNTLNNLFNCKNTNQPFDKHRNGGACVPFDIINFYETSKKFPECTEALIKNERQEGNRMMGGIHINADHEVDRNKNVHPNSSLNKPIYSTNMVSNNQSTNNSSTYSSNSFAIFELHCNTDMEMIKGKYCIKYDDILKGTFNFEEKEEICLLFKLHRNEEFLKYKENLQKNKKFYVYLQWISYTLKAHRYLISAFCLLYYLFNFLYISFFIIYNIFIYDVKGAIHFYSFNNSFLILNSVILIFYFLLYYQFNNIVLKMLYIFGLLVITFFSFAYLIFINAISSYGMLPWDKAYIVYTMVFYLFLLIPNISLFTFFINCTHTICKGFLLGLFVLFGNLGFITYAIIKFFIISKYLTLFNLIFSCIICILSSVIIILFIPHFSLSIDYHVIDASYFHHFLFYMYTRQTIPPHFANMPLACEAYGS